MRVSWRGVVSVGVLMSAYDSNTRCASLILEVENRDRTRLLVPKHYHDCAGDHCEVYVWTCRDEADARREFWYYDVKVRKWFCPDCMGMRDDPVIASYLGYK